MSEPAATVGDASDFLHVDMDRSPGLFGHDSAGLPVRGTFRVEVAAPIDAQVLEPPAHCARVNDEVVVPAQSQRDPGSGQLLLVRPGVDQLDHPFRGRELYVSQLLGGAFVEGLCRRGMRIGRSASSVWKS